MGRKKSNRSAESTTQSSSSPPQRPQSLLCVRFFILVLLAGFAALSIYVLHSLTSLTHQIDEEDSLIHSLQKKVADQQLIINRFNNSVTNTDVLDKVNTLEQSLQQTEHDMKDSLAKTTSGIQTLLDTTVATLDQTVVAAQNEIQHEVDLVKGDVEQYVRTTQDQFSMENSFMVYQIAGTFTLVACLISMWHMTAHIRTFKRPFVQRKVLAILWMSPIYSITSWLSLVFPHYEGYLGIIKDFYEAYIIYQFLGFCISVLGRGDRDRVVTLLAHHADHLEPPLRFFGWCRGEYTYPSAKALADAVLMQCQIFAMQFVFFKPMTSIVMFTCNNMHYYGGGQDGSDYRSPQFWTNIVQNISVFTAFSGLLKFYHAVQDDLAWCRPFPKFLCIKGIVFMTFWQGLVIGFLASRTSIAGEKSAEDENNDKDLWGKQAQNFLICLEMLLFSIAHFYCFPTEEWQEGYRPAVEKKMSMGDNMAFGDFVSDLKLIMGGDDSKKKKAKIAPPKKEETQTGLENPSPSLEENIDVEQQPLIAATSTIDEDGHQGGQSRSHTSDDTRMSDDDHDDTAMIFDPDTSMDMDTMNESSVEESFDLEQLSSRIDSTVRESLISEDENVREAAHRLQDKMQSLRQIEEVKDEDESKPASGTSYGAIGEQHHESEDSGDSSEHDDDALDGGIPSPSNEHERDEEVGETTSLLGGGTANLYSGDPSDVQLRPSIFTTRDEQ